MDNIYLTGPQGSTLSLGTWLRADPGPDYGVRDLVQQIYSENALVEGGVLAYEREPTRKMRFPLIVASGGAGLSLDLAESWLRTLVRPGGFVDLQPQGVPTAEMVRFDILGGRVNHDGYNVRLQTLARRMVVVELDTPPFGYWPTWITLASTLVQNFPVKWAVPQPSAAILGDAPGLVRLAVQPSAAAMFQAAGTWHPDFLAWSLAARPSHPLILGASLGKLTWEIAAGTYRSSGDLADITATAVDLFGTGAAFGAWTRVARYVEANAGQMYHGRHRLYGWLRVTPSMNECVQLSADVVDSAYLGESLASAAPVATLAPVGASGFGYGAPASQAYTLIDFGEIAFPRHLGASGRAGTPEAIRLWAKASSGVATITLSVGGFYLHPLEGPNGIMPRGLVVPSIGTFGFGGRLELLTDRRSVDLLGFSADITPDTDTTKLPGTRYHSGGLPYIGASTAFLTLLAGTRRVDSAATGPVTHGARIQSALSIQYRPRFQFLKGL